MNTEQQTSPMKAIKLFCREQCCCVGPDNEGGMDAWKNCNIEECQLHPFRLGKNPFRKKRKLTDKQRQAIADRLQKAREESNG